MCIVAGKSGGHIIPGIVLANRECASNGFDKVLFFTADNPLDKSIISDTNFDHIALALDNFPRKNILGYPLFMSQVFFALVKSFIVLYKNKPSKIISTGGYISLPVCLAAKLLGIPIQIFELNVIPGLAAKILSYLSDDIVICFEDAKKFFKNKCVSVQDYPVKFSDDHKIENHIARKMLGIDINKKVLFVLGGSQGSSFINDLIVSFVQSCPDKLNDLHIVHQTGALDYFKIKKFYKDTSVSVTCFDYIDKNLNYYYAISDLIISRAGAGSLFETKFFGKKAIIVPLKTNTTDHQLDNAIAMHNMLPELFVVAPEDFIKNDLDKFYNQIWSFL